MMDGTTGKAIDTVIMIATYILVIALIAVLVSSKSQTSNVLSSFASAFSSILSVVVNPISNQVSGNANTTAQGNPGLMAGNAGLASAMASFGLGSQTFLTDPLSAAQDAAQNQSYLSGG